jgi:hypothetical protein
VVHWLATGAALVIALAALARALSLGPRLEALGDDSPPAPEGSFIPLSALKR